MAESVESLEVAIKERQALIDMLIQAIKEQKQFLRSHMTDDSRYGLVQVNLASNEGALKKHLRAQRGAYRRLIALQEQRVKDASSKLAGYKKGLNSLPLG